MQKVIKFQTEAQVILFKCELLGQISDGFWENSKPHNHYKAFSDIDVKTDVQVGKNFFTKRKYNFANKMLVDIIGDRMIAAVRFFQAFPNIDMDYHWDYPESLTQSAVEDWAKNIISLQKGSGEYYVARSERVLKNFPGCTTQDELVKQVMQGVSKFPYEMKNLRKDLLAISKVVNA